MTMNYEELSEAYKKGQAEFAAYRKKCENFAAGFKKTMDAYLGAENRFHVNVNDTGAQQQDGTWLTPFVFEIGTGLKGSIQFHIEKETLHGQLVDRYKVKIACFNGTATADVFGDDTGLETLCKVVCDLVKVVVSDPLASFSHGKLSLKNKSPFVGK